MTRRQSRPVPAWAPSRREAILSALGVLATALLVRICAASMITFPAPEDTAYYVGVARNLLAGHGLVSDALWSYTTPPLVFPRPAFEVWLPLPTLLAAIPMALLGSSFSAAQWSAVIVGSLVPVLAWRLGADLALERRLPAGRGRSIALGSGLVCAVYLPLVLHSGLPDSTMPFATLALATCLVVARATRIARPSLRMLVSLGLLMGVAALARNEAAWLALGWVVAVAGRPGTMAERVRLVGVVGAVALVVFAPWAARDWLVFGNPLPGQALANALSLDGRDIFAWQEPPTLARYLAAGPGAWVGTRLVGLGHNLFSVLLLPGMPMSLIGLAGLAAVARARALRPLVLLAGVTFTATTLLFPVATTWGTFLHAAGPVHVLLIIGCLTALDSAIAAVGRRRGWSNPTAWLGPSLGVAAGLLFTLALLPAFGETGREAAGKYAALRTVLADLDPAGGPVITDFPIWLAEETGRHGLALPNEQPSSVLDLAARFPGTRLLIVDDRIDSGRWPSILAQGLPGSACFQPVSLPASTGLGAIRALESTRLYRISCP